MLSDPFTLPCGTVMPGRIVKAAMTEGLADDWGLPTAELNRLYTLWSTDHNAGHVMITGNIQVDRRYCERPGNVAIELCCPRPAERLEALRAYASAAQQSGTRCLAQLSHGGRQSNVLVNKEGLAPSAISAKALVPVPTAKEMTLADITDVVARFTNAAIVCKEAGFSGIQLHAAHGYLLSSFLSPNANKRTDAYGGDLGRRSLLLFQVYEACREAVGQHFCISVKLNSSDFQNGGFTEDDAVDIARRLEERGVDMLEISGGSYENPSMMMGPDGFAELQSLGRLGKATSTQLREGYFLVFAEKIQKSITKMPLMVTGGFRSKAVMEKALADGACQFIGIARPACGSPDCVAKLLKNEISELPRYEVTLAIPWYLRFLNYVIVGHLIKAGGTQMWTYRNIYRMGNGEEPTTERNANLIADMIFMEKYHTTKARNMLGMDKSVVGTVLNAKATGATSALKLAKQLAFVVIPIAIAAAWARQKNII